MLATSQKLGLRDYQETAIAAIRERYAAGVTRQLLSLPTGAGKTVVAAHLVERMGMRTVFMVHRDELVKQTVHQMEQTNPALSIGVCKAEKDELDRFLIVASAQTIAHPQRLGRLVDAVGHGSLLISDECHHDLAVGRRRVIDTLSPALLVGLTATPMRGDKLGLDAIYQEIVYHLPIKYLVDRNKLARPIGLRIETDTDIDAVHTTAGEFQNNELEAAVDTDARNRLIVDSWKRHASDRKRTVAFCVSVAHAKALRDAFREADISSEMVDGTTPIEERQRIYAAFRAGTVPVLTNCMVLTEGYDEPGIDAILMARPTKSTGLYIQCVGRGLRWRADKPDCMVIDFVDATTRHKLVTLPSLAGASGDPKDRPLSEDVRKQGEMIDLFDVVEHQGKIRERAAIMLDLLAETGVRWQAMPDGMYMAPAGHTDPSQKGWVTLIDDGDGYVPVRVWMHKGEHGYERLFERPTDAETAMSIAESRISPSLLTRKDALWTTRRPTPAQVEGARKWGFAVTPDMTRGQVSDLMDVAAFRAAMRKCGLSTRRTA